MNYLLLVLLVLLLVMAIITYIIFGKELSSPTFISCIVFSVGSMVAYIGNKSWKMEISFSLVWVILFAIFGMLIGEYMARVIIQQRNLHRKHDTCPKIIIDIPKKIVLVLFFLGIVADFLYYKRLCQISGIGISNFIGLISKVNSVRTNSDEHIGIIVAGLNVIESVSFNFLIAAFINNSIVLKKGGIKKYKYYLLMFIPYVFSIIIGGSRIFLISILSCIMFGILFFYRRYYGTKGNSVSLKTLVKIMIFGLTALYVIFSFMGTMSGKINSRTNSSSSFLVYTGSSLVDLSVYVSRGITRSTAFGAHTFTGVYNTLNRFLVLPSSIDVGLGYITLGTGTLTNVYTAFAAYIVDFGFIGMFILQIILGILYTTIFYYVTKRSKTAFCTIVYFMSFSYGLIGQLFAPETVSGMLTVNDILGILVYVLYYYLLEKRFKNIVE